MTVAYNITDSSVVMFDNGRTYNVDNSSPNYASVLAAIKMGDFKAAIQHATTVVQDVVHDASNLTYNDLRVVDGIVYKGDNLVNNAAADQIKRLYDDGFDIKPMYNFLTKLYTNPSKRSIDLLWAFIESGHVPLTPEGDILCYKAVRSDYKDHYTGTIDNSPGAVVSVPRSEVDDDPQRTCSHGLHVAVLSYAKMFGSGRGKIVVVKVDPADIVCVPYDYRGQKCRTSKYTVIADLDDDLRSTGYTDTVINDDLTEVDRPDDLTDNILDDLLLFVEDNSFDGYTDLIASWKIESGRRNAARDIDFIVDNGYVVYEYGDFYVN